jgi:hypothetical protein
MKKTYYIIGFEASDTWAHPHEFYTGEANDILQTDSEIEKAVSFETEDHAISKLNYLRENYNDIGWYILIEYED